MRSRRAIVADKDDPRIGVVERIEVKARVGMRAEVHRFEHLTELVVHRLELVHQGELSLAAAHAVAHRRIGIEQRRRRGLRRPARRGHRHGAEPGRRMALVGHPAVRLFSQAGQRIATVHRLLAS